VIAVLSCVAIGTERNQILQSIIPQLASRPQMMDVQVSRRPASLAAPAVSIRDLVTKLVVGGGIQS
jgi:hypothetical protein